MSNIRALFRIVAIAFLSLCYVIKANLLALFYCANSDKKRVMYRRHVKKWAILCLKVLNIELDVDNNTSQNVDGIIMSNHRSYVDIFIVLSMFPASIVAKDSLKKWPVVGWAISMADMILVNRSSLKSSKQTMQAIDLRLRAGKSVILFPEGGIFQSPFPAKFKNGSFKIACDLRADICPIALYYHNAEDAWYKSESFIHHFFKTMGKKKTFISVRILPKVSSSDLMETKAIVHNSINKSIEDMHCA